MLSVVIGFVLLFVLPKTLLFLFFHNIAVFIVYFSWAGLYFFLMPILCFSEHAIASMFFIFLIMFHENCAMLSVVIGVVLFVVLFFSGCAHFWWYCCVISWYEFVIFLVNKKWFPFQNCSLHFIPRSKNEIFRIRGNLSRNEEMFWFEEYLKFWHFFQTRNFKKFMKCEIMWNFICEK